MRRSFSIGEARGVRQQEKARFGDCPLTRAPALYLRFAPTELRLRRISALRVTITISHEGESAGWKRGRDQARGARARLRLVRSNSAAVTSRSVAS